MNARRDPETTMAAWLDEGPSDLPDATRRAILTALPTTPQARRGPLAPWRSFPMNVFTRLAAAAVVAVVVMGGALYVLGWRPAVGGPRAVPTATPAASSSPATAGWLAFSSPRYAYDIAYPPDWTATPATRDWSVGSDPPIALTSGADVFGAAHGPYLTVFATRLGVGETDAEWIARYYGLPARAGSPDPCTHVPASLEPARVGGHPVTFYKELDGPACGSTTAFVWIDDHVFVFTVTAVTLEPLLKDFLSTVTFGPWTLPTYPPIHATTAPT